MLAALLIIETLVIFILNGFSIRDYLIYYFYLFITASLTWPDKRYQIWFNNL